VIEIVPPLKGPRQLRTIFCAGGITGCPDWQAVMMKDLAGTDLVVFNPRRPDFDVKDPNASLIQIRWEHDHLREADAILFWFPHETLCPIVLYELGAWSMTDKKIFVGVDPGYKRLQDVIIQTELARPEVVVVSSLGALADQVISWSREP
jgi:hypothetical protein